MLDHQDIARCFNAEFAASERTVLVGGAQEPLYLPPRNGAPAELRYREDFAASALHETAHWSIAGPTRRRQQDFGYAYQPPPRDAAAQARFFAAELTAQALEAVFAGCAGLEFRASADNLYADLAVFEEALRDARSQTLCWLQTAAGCRAQRFCRALARSSRSPLPWIE